MNLFVSGTDTGIGKTLVSASLCLKLGWRYWKPIQSGMLEVTDSEWVREFISPLQVWPEAYRLGQPLSPHTSAAREGVKIDIETIVEQSRGMDQTVIEGAGGLLVPLNVETLIIDLIKRLEVRPLLVARSGLGTINHTLLSLESLRARKMNPYGVVMIGQRSPENREAIEFYGKTKVLGEIPMFSTLDKAALIQAGELIQLKAGDL